MEDLRVREARAGADVLPESSTEAVRRRGLAPRNFLLTRIS